MDERRIRQESILRQFQTANEKLYHPPHIEAIQGHYSRPTATKKGIPTT